MNSLQDLKTAQNAYTAALVQHMEEKFDLKNAEAEIIEGGVDGKNQAERDAQLRIRLRAYHNAEHKAGIGVIKARGALLFGIKTIGLKAATIATPLKMVSNI